MNENNLIAKLNPGKIYFLCQNELLIRRFIEDNFENGIYDYELYYLLFMRNAEIAHILIKDALLTNEEKQEKFLNHYLKMSYGFSCMVASPGSGKSTFKAWMYDELIKRGLKKRIYYLGSAFSQEKIPYYAKGIECTRKILDKTKQSFYDLLPEKNCCVEIDELTELTPKGSMTNADLGNTAIYRHNGLIISANSQNSSIISIDFLRFCDMMMFLTTSFLQDEFERDSPFFQFIRLMRPMKKGEVLVMSDKADDKFFFKFTFPVPDFWNDNLSKSHQS